MYSISSFSVNRNRLYFFIRACDTSLSNKKYPNNIEDCSCDPVGPRRKSRQLGALINYCSDICVSFLLMSQTHFGLVTF
jgi:hypothetical protein